MFAGAFIPEGVCRLKDLSPGSKLLYGRLYRFAGNNGEAWPAIETLAEEVGISESTCRRYLQELEKYRLIDQEFHTGGTTHYHFKWHTCFQPSPGEETTGFVLNNGGCQFDTPVNTGGVNSDRGGVSTVTPEESHRRESDKTTPPTPSKLEIVAGEIHQRHPHFRRDCGPVEVRKHLNAILQHGKKNSSKPWPGDDLVLDFINRNHANWCNSPMWTKDDGEFAKGLSNWLAPTMGRYKAIAPEVYKKPVHFV